MKFIIESNLVRPSSGGALIEVNPTSSSTLMLLMIVAKQR